MNNEMVVGDYQAVWGGGRHCLQISIQDGTAEVEIYNAEDKAVGFLSADDLERLRDWLVASLPNNPVQRAIEQTRMDVKSAGLSVPMGAEG